jgi:hypothetical protein
MTDDDIRTVIRDVLAARGACAQLPQAAPRVHASQLRLVMVAPTEPGSPCVIEPAVTCNQCGYCVSMGH